MYTWLIHLVVWQNPTQYCKATSLQVKTEKSEEKKKKRLYLKSCKVKPYRGGSACLASAERLENLFIHVQNS